MERIPTRQERFTAHAETLRAKFATGILKSMQQKPLWSLYRLEKDQQGNLHKRPYHPRGYPASIYKPRSWSSLDAVLEALATGTFSGIGIFLPDPYALIDVDTKEDAPVYDREKKNIVSPFVLRLLQEVPSYAELSPNKGAHILTVGRPTRGNFKTEQLEMYTNWFSTVTTHHVPGTPLDITEQQKAIEALENEFHPPAPVRMFQNTGGVSEHRFDGLPAEAAGDPVLQELLRGDMSRYGNDHHRADWVLLMKLLHWTGDDRQLAKRLFFASPLGQREKAQDETGVGRRGKRSYVDRTIDRIIEMRYNPPQTR